VLALVVAAIMTLLSLAVGMPYALAMGALAGLLEFLPSIGHGIWLFTASILLFFQGSTWIPVPNWAAMVLVIGLHIVFQQVDLNYLIPRIIGRRVRLHPLVVILGIVAGATVAEVLGVMLAAPTIASAWIRPLLFCGSSTSAASRKGRMRQWPDMSDPQKDEPTSLPGGQNAASRRDAAPRVGGDLPAQRASAARAGDAGALTAYVSTLRHPSFRSGCGCRAASIVWSTLSWGWSWPPSPPASGWRFPSRWPDWWKTFARSRRRFPPYFKSSKP
jgi:hypothetical protein